MSLSYYIQLSEEVAEAKRTNKPVVALESTIISHGMPYPQNIETARNVEKIIRDKGAVPATIAIMDGKIKIGLSDSELVQLGKEKDVEKVSRRDLPAVLASKKTGATTVAATMICADLAGIRVFVTGGIGGVHRGAQETMDISADLQELAKTNVAVVCAGAKSILDIGLTLEYLETQGVPVIGYQTSDFPAFYTRQSGYGVDVHAQSAEEIAHMLHVKWELNLEGGAVIGNPVPREHEMDPNEVDNIIHDAVKAANDGGITGKETTPFLLNRLKEISQGATLTTNIALVENNAVTGADIALALNALKTTSN
ncbi:pseudouridine-5'-phosphate glycosidase [Salipaludibacillus agaradhaerens]|uniref:Pseudouridine-5'-phosphate glycosidase n=1 Tax=Salipaludibacillus agaradhaerens TaxID=76935 RepID=A0A9Q4FZQ9_SALAG|nr:pseudouridine-5'-phosphate glycosidase [Salipaludibacillus agaradhaerens]MCR6097053.1 pseudouridine-5'-phosphate glycosidase [Salipaludibacillus agaradhaerens]MCR6113462.1 pseudouridine-5'-phosphate glycosidase [Salipaludibacillus agaradhaerens]